MERVVKSNVSHKKLNSVYLGLQGVTGISHDIIMYFKKDLEHNTNLILFLETMQKNGLMFNKEKLKFKKERSFSLWT